MNSQPERHFGPPLVVARVRWNDILARLSAWPAPRISALLYAACFLYFVVVLGMLFAVLELTPRSRCPECLQRGSGSVDKQLLI